MTNNFTVVFASSPEVSLAFATEAYCGLISQPNDVLPKVAGTAAAFKREQCTPWKKKALRCAEA